MAYETEHSLSTGQPNNTTAQANLLSDGVLTIGALGSASDVDYYKIVTTGPALINLNFATSVTSSSTYWNIGLLDSAGLDYLLSPTRSLTGTPQIDGASQADNTLDVKGLSALPAAGSRFTIATSGADTTIYTVVTASQLSSGTSTLTLDKAVSSPADAAYLVFDPVNTSVGASTSLRALVDAAGTYYVRVSKGDVASSQEYSVTPTVTSTVESDFNDTKADAAMSNNHLLSGVAMTGNLSDDQDKDVWLFTTAVVSDFTLDFAAAGGSAASADWKITVSDWSGQSILNSNGTAISLSAGTSASASVLQANNQAPKTYVVTVEAAKAGASSGNYTLKVSGTALDLNDTPVMMVGSVSSSASNTVIDTGVIKSIQAGAASSLLLSSLFSATDADTGQTLGYVVSLAKPAGSESAGYLKVGDTSYGFGSGMTSAGNIVLTASQMAAAKFYAGTVTGDLTLTLQAIDSSGASDGSDHGAFMQQTLRVVNAGYAVHVSSNTATTLQESNSSSTDTLSITLGTPDVKPADGETVTLYLEHDGEASGAFQLSYSTSVLTFNSTNYATPQTVTVTAREDGIKEVSQTGKVSFRVVSSDTTSAFNNLLVDTLTYTLTDASNHAPTGSVTISGTATQGQTLTAANSLADSDGLGTITYLWQQSSDDTNWSTIAGSGTGSTYTLANAQVDKYIRVLANYTDALSNAESVPSATLASGGSSVKVSNINDAPTVANAIADQTAVHGSIYNFTVPGNAFSDIDPAGSGGTLSYTATLDDGSALPAWLTFNPSTRTFSSDDVTPSASSVISVKVTATDNAATPLSASDIFTITVSTAVAGSPVLAKALVDQAATQTVPFSYTVAASSFTDTASNGTTDTSAALTYSATLADGSSLPTWLSFSSTGGLVFTGTPGNSDVGTLSVKVTASDGTSSVSDIFDIVVANVNDAPTGSVAIDGIATQGNTLTASNTLADIDGMGTVFYQWQSSSNGTDWSSISGANSSTLKLAQEQVGKLVRVVASYTDGHGTVESYLNNSNQRSSATTAVANINDSPVAVADTASATEAGGIGNGTVGTNPSGNVLTNDTDPDTGSGDTKTVSAISGGNVGIVRHGNYGDLALNADGSYSYTLNNENSSVQALRGSDNTLTDTFTYTVRDTAGLTSTANLVVTIHGANDAPTVAHEIADPADVYAGNAWSPAAFALNTFNDVDAGDTLSYTATLSNGDALPSWLSFNAATRTFSSDGVTASAGTTVNVKVTATDSGSLSVSDTFVITIKDPGTDAPTLATPTAVALTDTAAADTTQSLLDASDTESGTLSGAHGSTAGAGDVLAYGISGGTDGGASVSKIGAYGTLVVTKATGAYTFTPNATTVNALSANASESFTVTVTDATLSTPLTTSKLLMVNVAGVNDTPTLATPLTATFVDTVNTDTVLTLNTGSTNRTGTLAGADQDTGTSLNYGISGGTDSGTTVTKAGIYSTLVVTKSSGAYTLTPNADAINAIAYDTIESFTVTVSDGTATANSTLTVNLTAANDQAINEVPRLTTISTLTGATEDTAYAISYAALQGASNAADIENQAISFRVEAVSSGTLTKNGTAVTAGETLLGSSDTFSWTPASNANGTLGAFTVKAVDAQGGVSATAVPVTVSVAAVNDPPVSSGAINDTSANELGINADGTVQAGHNASGVANSLMANSTDPDGTTSFTITNARESTAGSYSSVTTGSTSVSNGLSITGLYGTLVVGADGSYAYTVNQTNSTVQALTETHSLSDTFIVQVSDGTGTGNQTINIVIDGTNDALPGSTDNSVIINEDTPVVLGLLTDFGTYTDNSGVEVRPFAGVKITTLESAGALKYSSDGTNWSDVTLNQEISAADIAAGKLRFDPAANANGTGYATIGFKVTDGDAYSASANTLTVNVTAVNDDPTGEVTITGTAKVGQTLTAHDTLSDADGLGTISYQWQSSSDNGSTWSNISGATTNTYALTASEVGKTISVKESYLDGGGTHESKTSGATAAVTSSSQTYGITVNTKYWNSETPIKGVVLESVHQTGDTGSVTLSGHTAGHMILTPALTADTTAKGSVDLLDAIAILKSIVGLTTLNGYQQVAADFDKANGVDLNDAIGILKHVVGLTAPTPEWAFVAKTDLPPDPAHAISVDVIADTTVDLVGILRGDVDGSWSTVNHA